MDNRYYDPRPDALALIGVMLTEIDMTTEDVRGVLEAEDQEDFLLLAETLAALAAGFLLRIEPANPSDILQKLSAVLYRDVA